MTSFNVPEILDCENNRGHASKDLFLIFDRVDRLEATNIAFECWVWNSPVNPLAIVLITSWSWVLGGVFSSFHYAFIVSWVWLCSRLFSHSRSWSRKGSLSLTNCQRCFFWINFSILSLRIVHSSELWPTTRWFKQLILRFVFPWGGWFLTASWINYTLHASFSARPRLFINGV